MFFVRVFWIFWEFVILGWFSFGFCEKRIFKLFKSFKICLNFCLLYGIFFRFGFLFIFILCKVWIFLFSIFVVLSLNCVVIFFSWFFECLCDLFRVVVNLVFSRVLMGFLMVIDFLNCFCIILIWRMWKIRIVFKEVLIRIY